MSDYADLSQKIRVKPVNELMQHRPMPGMMGGCCGESLEDLWDELDEPVEVAPFSVKTPSLFYPKHLSTKK